MHVVVVGGGLTGLVAARALRAQDIAVTLIDRGALLGGRLRHRDVDVPGCGRATLDPAPVFLGPACYPEHDPDAPVGLPAVGLRAGGAVPGLAARSRRTPIAHLSAGDGAPIPSRLTVAGGARALLDLLLPRGCDDHLIHRGWTEVTALEPDGEGWRVRTRECGSPGGEPGPTGTVRADAVLLTQPVPDAIRLLDGSGVEWNDTVRDELRRVRYSRTMVLTAVCRGPSQLPAGMLSFSDAPLALLFDNHATGASAVGPALTAVVSADWAEAHWDEPDEAISRQLLPFVAPWVGGEVVWHRVERCGRYRASDRPRMPFAQVSDLPPLVLAGDGFGGFVTNPLDAAHTSAVHATAHLCRVLGRVANATGRKALRTPTRPVLEVAVSSEEEAISAVENGADRLLLLAAPEVGGLTPTLDTFLAVRRAARSSGKRRGKRVPVVVLLRPRLGECGYTRSELTQMERDAARFLKARADGIALGALVRRGDEVRVDVDGCRPLVALAHAAGKEAVFHRAFDRLNDRRTGLQDLIALGFDRVVTGGRWKLAIDGTAELAADAGYAAWQIEVVAAGGITADTAGYVVGQTGCRQLLAGCREPAATGGTSKARPFSPAVRAFLPGQVRAMAATLRQLADEDEPVDADEFAGEVSLAGGV